MSLRLPTEHKNGDSRNRAPVARMERSVIRVRDSCDLWTMPHSTPSYWIPQRCIQATTLKRFAPYIFEGADEDPEGREVGAGFKPTLTLRELRDLRGWTQLRKFS